MEKRKESSADTEVLIVYTFNAPRELVFKAWTDARHLENWYAPHGCTVKFSQLDLRKGGSFRCCIYNPAFGPCWSKGTYKDIVAPERIVYSLILTDGNGNAVSAKEVGMDPDWPTETLVTLTFTEQGGKTWVTLHQTVSEALAKRTGAHPSWLQMLERFGALLENYH
jgi:uncharacterized protein YndB with AHSA1/START domain